MDLLKSLFSDIEVHAILRVCFSLSQESDSLAWVFSSNARYTVKVLVLWTYSFSMFLDVWCVHGLIVSFWDGLIRIVLALWNGFLMYFLGNFDSISKAAACFSRGFPSSWSPHYTIDPNSWRLFLKQYAKNSWSPPPVGNLKINCNAAFLI